MGLSFPELRRRAHVNVRAKAADSAADFSRRIRAWNETSVGAGTYDSGTGKPELPLEHLMAYVD
jgi:hypothetical protein